MYTYTGSCVHLSLEITGNCLFVANEKKLLFFNAYHQIKDR